MERDVKGMYKMAQEGKIKNFTGVDDPFDEPKHADIVVDTDKQSLEESLKTILDAIAKTNGK
jgi:adenylylsulfate kinase